LVQLKTKDDSEVMVLKIIHNRTFMGERGRGREREQLLLKGDRNLCKERKEARESHEFVIVVKR
jgi:hypothetical protein